MSTKDEAFHDHPPEITLPGRFFFKRKVQLRPFSERVSVLCNKLLTKIEDSTDFSAVGAYVLVSQCEARQASRLLSSITTNEQLEMVVFGLSDSDYNEVQSYIERVIERRNKSQFEVLTDDKPGKPSRGELETMPATPQPYTTS